MKKYIFLTHFDEEGFEGFEGLDSSTSGLGIVEGKNPKDAFDNLRKKEKFEYIGNSGDYENYICYELVDGKMKEFNLDTNGNIII